jgi:ArsR family transcriptional regulator
MERIPGNVRRREAFGGPPSLARFFRGMRLETMPAKEPDRLAVLAYIATFFDRGREYTEGEVNRVLGDVDADFATLRRYLIDAGLLRRERSIYRKV